MRFSIILTCSFALAATLSAPSGSHAKILDTLSAPACDARYASIPSSDSQAIEVPPEFTRLKHELRSGGRIRKEIPEISDSELTSKTIVMTNGTRGGKISWVATYRGKKVFIKPEIPPRNDRPFESEWLYLLNRLGLGPKLVGVTEIAGVKAIVMEYVEGVDTIALELKQKVGKIPLSALADMRKAGEILEAAGINPDDLQFQITPEGRAVLIDPADFTFLAADRPNVAVGMAERVIAELRKAGVVSELE